MTSKELWISEDCWRKLYLFRESLKSLFDVDISVKSTDSLEKGDQVADSTSEKDNFLDTFLVEYPSDSKIRLQLLLATNSLPENIEKAQKYFCACLPSSSKYSFHLSSLQAFKNVYYHRTQIQQSSSSLLKFDSDCLKITIYGLESCVKDAKKEIKMVLDDCASNEPKNVVNSQANSLFNRQMEHILPNESKTFHLPKSEILEETFSREGSLDNWGTENTSSASEYINNQNRDNQTTMDILHADGKHISLEEKSSPVIIEESDEENIHVLTDSRNSQQVEQAVKLGYNLSQIEIALEKLGPGCMTDDLLRELIDIGNEQSETKVISSDSIEPLLDALNEFSVISQNVEHPSTNEQRNLAPSRPFELDASENLRSIVIDGSNVAMSHGLDKFSCRGIKIAVDWFKQRGHTDICVFVPEWRKEASRPDAPIEDQHILLELERERILSFTPSRRVQGRRIVSYDDRFILKHASAVDGIVVSKDVYRDLVRENEQFRKVVEERLLMYTFVKDIFMPPDDPLGRLGPSLDDFLRKVPSEPPPRPQDCPYGKKCTYGNKCRYYHPERGFVSQKSITDTLKEQANISRQEIASKKSDLASEKGKRQKQKLIRTESRILEDFMPECINSDLQSDSARIKSKSKLGNAKSRVTSNKTSDYLTASRLKLEKAETADSLGSFILPDKKKSEVVSISPKIQKQRNRSLDTVGSHSSSSGISPVSTSESLISGGVPDSSFEPSYPLSSLSFTHLAVPSPEPQEGYSSGHLSVAKKLSDEGSEKNFFEGSKSSPSPPNSLGDISSSEEKNISIQTSANPNIFRTESHDKVSVDSLCSPHSFVSTESADVEYTADFFTDDGPYYGDPHSTNCDSGNYSMFGSPHPQMASIPHSSYPPVSKGRGPQAGRQSLHRSLSTSHSMTKPDKVSRRSSDFTGIRNEPNFPQQIHPSFGYYNSQGYRSVPTSLSHWSATPGSEVHAWSDNIYDSGHSIELDGTVSQLEPLQEAYNVNQQPMSHQSQHFPLMQQMPPPYQQNFPHNGKFLHPHNINKANKSHPFSGERSFTPPSHYNPIGHTDTSHAYPVSPGYQQAMQSQAHYGLVMSPGPCPPVVSPLLYNPSLLHQPTQFGHPNMYQGHTLSPSGYSASLAPSHYTQPFTQYKQENPNVHSQGTHTKPAPVDVDAQIPQEDSRYPILCHLSTIYGEKVVRNFMNRNPDVKDVPQLITLIEAYKVEHGL